MMNHNYEYFFEKQLIIDIFVNWKYEKIACIGLRKITIMLF